MHRADEGQALDCMTEARCCVMIMMVSSIGDRMRHPLKAWIALESFIAFVIEKPTVLYCIWS